MKLITQAELAKRIGVSAAYIVKLKKRGVFEGCFYGKKLKEECAIKAINSFRKNTTGGANKTTEGVKKNAKDIDSLKKDIKKSLPKEAAEALSEDDVNKLAVLLAKVDSPAARVSITKEFWAGKLNEIKYLKEKGKLLDKSEIESAFAEIALSLREKFLSLPSRISGVLAAESDKSKIINILEDEIREILENLSLELKSEA